MRVRALEPAGDWTFGKGRNNYKSGIDATVQNLSTRLKSFVGDCFFDMFAGIDWFTFCGSKRIDELKIAITTVILNTENVVSCNEVSVIVGAQRKLLIQYDVNTSFGTVKNTFEV